MSTIEERLAAIEASLAGLKPLVQKFSWEEKTSESGIQLAGGPTTITKKGYLRSVTAVPTPQGMAFAFVLQDETTNRFAILSPDLIKPCDD